MKRQTENRQPDALVFRPLKLTMNAGNDTLSQKELLRMIAEAQAQYRRKIARTANHSARRHYDR